MDANRTFGHLRPPTAEQIKKYAARYHMTLSDEHAADFVSVMSAIMMDIDKIDELPEPPAPRPSRPEIRADRPRQKKTPITRSSASAPSEGRMRDLSLACEQLSRTASPSLGFR